MDDYDTWHRYRLCQLLADRNIRHNHLKRRPQLIAAARKSDRKQARVLKEHIAEERKAAFAHIQKTKDGIWTNLFEREFRADPAKKSFMDLPREIRDIFEYSSMYGFEAAVAAVSQLHVALLIYYSPTFAYCGHTSLTRSPRL